MTVSCRGHLVNAAESFKDAAEGVNDEVRDTVGDIGANLDINWR